MSTAAQKILLGWSAFAGTHMIMSHRPIRQQLIAYMGDKNFKMIYSVVAIGILAPTTIVYLRHQRALSQLGSTVERGALLSGTSVLLKTLGLQTFAQAVTTQSPSSMQREISLDADQEIAHGIVRVSRHAVFLSTGLWGLANVLTATSPAAVVYWAGYPIFWLVGSLHQDSRQRHDLPARYYEETSILPFAAIIEGRNSFSKALDEMNLTAAGVALVVGASLFGARMGMKVAGTRMLRNNLKQVKVNP
eukprot:GILK01007951.1.p1 GENE.GILK01007951.1~~GILK01007951.1.p1  ORF type:complete len:262 (-),score=26.66 GILK01007951.1:178-921(-)